MSFKKNPEKRMKKQNTNWEKIFADTYTTKDLYPEYKNSFN